MVDAKLKEAKKFLMCCPRDTFDVILNQANLSSRQRSILELLFKQRLTEAQAANKVHLAIRTLQLDVRTALLNIYYVLVGGSDLCNIKAIHQVVII